MTTRTSRKCSTNAAGSIQQQPSELVRQARVVPRDQVIARRNPRLALGLGRLLLNHTLLCSCSFPLASLAFAADSTRSTEPIRDRWPSSDACTPMNVVEM